MIMFVIFHDLHVVEYGNRQEPYICLLFYVACVPILSPCNCFTLSLRVSIVVVAIVGDGTHGDDAVMLVMMEIMPVLCRCRSKLQEEKAIPYHNIYIAFDVNPFMHLIACLYLIATVA